MPRGLFEFFMKGLKKEVFYFRNNRNAHTGTENADLILTKSQMMKFHSSEIEKTNPA